jgi:uncharacterized RDD family membrane protein YckC
MGKPHGPAEEIELWNKFASNELGPETLVWTQGMEHWLPAREVEPFANCWKTSEERKEEAAPSEVVKAVSWYYMEGHTIRGPVPMRTFCQFLREGKLGADTLVRPATESKWRILGSVINVAAFAQAPPCPRTEIPKQPLPMAEEPKVSVSSPPSTPVGQVGPSWEQHPSMAPQAQAPRRSTELGAPPLRYGRPRRRYLARLVDVVVIIVIGSVVLVLGVSKLSLSSFYPQYVLQVLLGWFSRSLLLSLLIDLLYFTILTGSSLQGTLGKAALGLKVCDLEGKRIDYARAFARHLCELVLLWLFALVGVGLIIVGTVASSVGAMLLGILVSFVGLFLNYLPVIFSSRRQTLYDMIVGTVVVEKD